MGYQPQQKPQRTAGDLGCLILLICIVVLVLFGWGSLEVGRVPGTDNQQIVARVTKTERVMDAGGQSSRYLVFTDQETLEDTDNWLAGKTNSSDVYGSIQVDHTYRFTVIGWRNPLFSAYRNIVQVEEIKP